LIRDYQN
jgi:hypothetical protein